MITHKIDDYHRVEITEVSRVHAEGRVIGYDGEIILEFYQAWDGCINFNHGRTRFHCCGDDGIDELARNLKTCRKVGLMAIGKHCAMQTDWLTQ